MLGILGLVAIYVQMNEVMAIFSIKDKSSFEMINKYSIPMLHSPD
jgi:hypothetical protein